MSEHRHWTEEELVEALYELRAAPEAECAQCWQRWQLALARLEQERREPEVSPQWLAAQRLAIQQRLEGGRRFPLRAALAAGACALGVTLVVWRPDLRQAPVQEAADEGLYQEVYSMAFSAEPRAAEPIRALFEEQE